jgi:Zn-dependent metalloprotease
MKRVLALLVAISLCGLASPLPPALGQGQPPQEPKGKITNSYREEQGTPPAWVESARQRSIAHLRRRGKALGLSNPEAELALAGVDQDDLGLTHVRFKQVHNGVPVFGGALITRLEVAAMWPAATHSSRGHTFVSPLGEI